MQARKNVTEELSAAPLRAKVRFASGSGFHATLKRRVDAYFDERGLAPTANGAMIAKTVFWLGAPALVYGVILSGILPPIGALALAMVLGFMLAGIGFNVGHDAIHGAYSSRPWLNELLGWSFQILGASKYTWAVAHNVVHHTYTNVPGHDDDIEPGVLMRFHTAHPARRAYRLQHLYAWFLYCFTSLVWVFQKDFVQVLTPDPRSGRRHPLSAVLSVLAAKALYASLFIVAPALLLPLPLWQLAIGYLAMHAVGGFTLAVVFQLAHVVEGPETPSAPSSGAMSESWAEHQLRTTANFARGSFLSQFICGGLNHQVEHHLFPRICHIHYPAIASIVEETAREFGLPYHEHENFLAAVRSHARTLRKLGTAPQRAEVEEALPVPAPFAAA